MILSAWGVGAHAQRSATVNATASAKIISARSGGAITVEDHPSFGFESSHQPKATLAKNSWGFTSNLGQPSATFVADVDQGYQINVCLSTPEEIVALNGSGGKLRTSVSVTSTGTLLHSGTHAQQSAANGQMRFAISAMAPDASAVSGGTYAGSFEVIVTYN